MIGAAALVAGIPLLGGEFALVIHFVVSILALIVAWFAVQAKQWWWALPMVAIAVLWNPVYPLELETPVRLVLSVVAEASFIAAGALVWVPRPAPAR